MIVQQAPPRGGGIVLGRQGENEARQIVFDVSGWEELYGEGTVILLHQRRGDSSPYPVTITQDGTTVVWIVSSIDTAKTGNGKAELQYIVGDTLAKSCTYRTNTAEALSAATTPPDAYETWLESLTTLAVEIQADVSNAAESAAEAKEAADNAAASASVAGESEANASNSANSAAASEANASAYAAAAGSSANEAADSSAAASASATAAAESAGSAAKSATAAAESADSTAKSATAASDSADAASAYASTAEKAASTAAESAEAAEAAAAEAVEPLQEQVDTNTQNISELQTLSSYIKLSLNADDLGVDAIIYEEE